jgi:serine/threonine protein phosphatase 1
MPHLSRSPLGRYVHKPENSQRWAIGDVHGCIQTLEKLLQKLNLQPGDQLFLVGDYINKGPDSLGVLRRLKQLPQKGIQLYAVRGNHEQTFLDLWAQKQEAKQTGESYDLREKLLSPDLLNETDEPHSGLVAWLKTLPYFLELDHYFIVHSNFNYEHEDPFLDAYGMMHSRSYVTDPTWTGDKVILHGHTPVVLSDIEAAIAAHAPIINLDNGCVMVLIPDDPRSQQDMGRLCAFNLDSRELICQECVD